METEPKLSVKFRQIRNNAKILSRLARILRVGRECLASQMTKDQ